MRSDNYFTRPLDFWPAEKKKAVYQEYYREHLDHLSKEYERYEENAKVPYKVRLDIEAHLHAIMEILKKNHIWMSDSYIKKNKCEGTDISELLIKFAGPGSCKVRDILFSNPDSCWCTLLREKTKEEMMVAADGLARTDAEFDERRAREVAELEQERRKKEKREAEAEKKENERRKRLRAEVESWQSDRKKFLDHLNSELNKFDILHKPSELDGFDESALLTKNQYAAVKRYVEECFRFSDAMNEGLSGFGLYTFNNDRTNAHENMLDQFDVGYSDLVREATKTYDFCDDYDVKTQKYKHKDIDDAIKMLAYVLVKAIEHENKTSNNN